MKKKAAKVILLTGKAISLIFCMVFLIEVVALLISGAHWKAGEATRKISVVTELIRVII